MASEGGCERCEALAAEVRQAREERDRTLLALARERERLNALQLERPAEAVRLSEVELAPLRYLLADRINDRLKAAVGPAHAGLRRALDRLGRRRGDRGGA